MATRWWQDIAVLIDGLDSYWTRTDENIAALVDRDDYYLTAQYRSWITDPSDPEVKREQMRRKRSGKKPPPLPILYPVAQRPEAVAKAHVEIAKQREQQAAATDVAENDRKVAPAELMQMLHKKGG